MRLAVEYCNTLQRTATLWHATVLISTNTTVKKIGLDLSEKHRSFPLPLHGLWLGSVPLCGMRLWGSMEWDSSQTLQHTATHSNTQTRLRDTRTLRHSNSMRLFCERLVYHTWNRARLAVLHKRQCLLSWWGSVPFDIRLWGSTYWDSESNPAAHKAQQHLLLK